MLRHVHPWLIVLVSLLLPLTAAAQEPPPAAEFEGEVRVTEVLLDVLVTDPQGNVVVGLGEDDFVVEEEGRRVPIESVSFYSNRSFVGGPGGGEATAGAPLAERWFVLFVYRPPVALARDDDRALYLKLPQVGKESFEWLVGDLLPGDHVAVVSYDARLTLHHDFSRDRDRLGRAIRRATQGQPPERWPSRTEAPQPGVTLAPLFAREDLAEATADLHDAVRLLAEERKSGSIEVLMTAPVTEGQVVLGKYLGVLVFYLFLWLPTVLYTLILSAYAEVDWGPIAAGYLGVVGIGALLLAAGLFASAVVADQLVAAILAFALMVPLVFGGLLLELLVDAPWLQDVLAYVNVIQHQQDFAQGIVDTRRLVYYLSATVFFLFLASRSLEGNKWR